MTRTMDRLRTLMVAPTPFFSDRGCHVRILGEARALAGLGHEVKLATYPLGRDMAGVDARRTIAVPWYRKLSAGPSYHKYYIDLLLALSTARLIRSFRPHVIHAHLHEGAAVARLARALAGRRRPPVLLDYQGSLTDEVLAHGFTRRNGLQHRMLRRVENRIHGWVDHVITSTARSRETLLGEWGCPPGRVTTVTDGADTTAFQPLDPEERARIRADRGIPADRVVGVYVGLLNEYQGIDLLIPAASMARDAGGPPVHYLMVGYPDVERYRAFVARQGLADRFTFTGRVPYEETAALTAAADFALTPKISASEGNLKIYNYMACGLPVVCFDNPVNREILEEVGVYAGDPAPERLARAIGELANDPARRDALGRLARSRVVERFSWEAAARRIEVIYGRLLGQRSPTPARPSPGDRPRVDGAPVS